MVYYANNFERERTEMKSDIHPNYEEGDDGQHLLVLPSVFHGGEDDG